MESFLQESDLPLHTGDAFLVLFHCGKSTLEASLPASQRSSLAIQATTELLELLLSLLVGEPWAGRRANDATSGIGHF
jgi:hypothetical protein